MIIFRISPPQLPPLSLEIGLEHDPLQLLIRQLMDGRSQELGGKSELVDVEWSIGVERSRIIQ